MHIVDMHCDTISELILETTGKYDENLRKNSKHVDLLRMKEAGYLLQNFALYVNKEKYPNVKSRVLELLDYYCAEIEKNSDLIAPVTCMADIEKNRVLGKMSSMLTIEEGAALEGSIHTLKDFFDKGVRMITLTWNYPNELGFPHGYNERTDGRYGLTSIGKEMVETMENMGIIVDVSHLSDEGFYDVLKCTRKPFAASHSNAREVCCVSRNLSDDMIRCIGERGGVIGLNFYPIFLGNNGTIESVISHAKHIINVGGVDVLGLGSDFDGIEGQKELLGVQTMPDLIDALQRAGFVGAVVEKILGGNVLRVYKDVIG